MKTKSFQKLLEKRLNKEEIAEIEAQALLEVKILQYLQKAISDAMSDYMLTVFYVYFRTIVPFFYHFKQS